ncbi:MAG TPA: hypothetical protein VMM92_09365, partial [Thermoanaerobaculia bacterium]|nr:hypothetical protein [Thermoanaerobaculia bacterium]
EHGEEGEESFALLGLGRAHAAMGDRTAAGRFLRRALALREGRPDRMGEAVARLALAENHLQLQQMEKAASEARRAHFDLSLLAESALLGDAEQLLGRIEISRRRLVAAGGHFAAALEIHLRQGDGAQALVDQSLQLELALTQKDGREARRLTEELAPRIEEVPTGQRATFAFRLAGSCEWLLARGQQAAAPASFLERAYRELLGIAGTLSQELRHRYLFEIAENAAILAAATSHHLVA